MLCALTNAARVNIRQSTMGTTGLLRTGPSPIPSYIRPTSLPLQQQRNGFTGTLLVSSGTYVTAVSIERQNTILLLVGCSLIGVGVNALFKEHSKEEREKTSSETKHAEDNAKSSSMDIVIAEDDDE